MSIPRKHRRRHLPTNTTDSERMARASRKIANFGASAPLRQALQDMPEISETSKHIMLEETKQGLNIEIVDQDGRSMFADGAKEPLERTRKLIQKIAPQLKAMPYRLSITGHTASSKVRQSPVMGPGNCLPIAPMPYARSWTRKAFRQEISIWWQARPTPIRFFPTTPICRQTGVSRSP
jgi:hypothetical protein